MDYDIYKKEVRIVIADDHEVVRNGIKRLLILDKALEIVGEGSNGEEAISLVEYHKPDIVMLDILMPVLDGIAATKEIKARNPEVFVLMLTAFEDSNHIEKALEAGADGYLTKDISAKNLVEAIHSVMKGERVFSKNIVNIVQNRYVSSNSDDSQVVITPREQEILNLVATGKTSPEIAEILEISFRTVQSHRSNIMQKLGIKTAAGLIRYSIMNQSKK